MSGSYPVAILAGQSALFVTACYEDECPAGPARRFKTNCNNPGSPVAAGLLTQAVPGPGLAILTGSGILPPPDE